MKKKTLSLKSKKTRRKIAALIALMLMTIFIGGCTGDTGISVRVDNSGNDQLGDAQKLAIVAAFYDNRGNNFINFEGQSFDIQPNRMKQ